MSLLPRVLCWCLPFVFEPLLLRAQQNDVKEVIAVKDSLSGFVAKMQRFAKASAASSAADFDADKAAFAQNQILIVKKLVFEAIGGCCCSVKINFLLFA